jgi:large subunit ribosomal protein L35
MPKIKTHRGAAKRFSLTAGRKVKRSKAFARHILTKKTAKRKRGLRQSTVLKKVDEGGIKKLIPYL